LDRFTWEPAALFLEKIRNYARRFQESSAQMQVSPGHG
jgi:hypothetical protein